MNARAGSARLLLLILPPLVLCAVAAAVRPADWKPFAQNALFTHWVYAYRDWQSVGIRLEQGDSFSVRARGEWQYSPLVGRNGPDGGRWAPDFYPLETDRSGARGGALLGRIGDDGLPFLVGRRTSASADAPGDLNLRINDDLLGDNVGRLQIEITVTRKQAAP